MLNKTRLSVEDLKKAGFERRDFSVQTKQDNKTGGWKESEIHFQTSNIKDRLFDESYLLKDTKEIGVEMQHFMRKRIKNLVKNDTNKNYRITEWHSGKGYIWYTISVTSFKSKFQVHVGYEQYEDMEIAKFKTIAKSEREE